MIKLYGPMTSPAFLAYVDQVLVSTDETRRRRAGQSAGLQDHRRARCHPQGRGVALLTPGLAQSDRETSLRKEPQHTIDGPTVSYRAVARLLLT